MPSFTFEGDQPYVFPQVTVADGSTLFAVPGEVYELDSAPDDRFVAVAPVTPIAPVATAADFEAASEPSDPSPATPAA